MSQELNQGAGPVASRPHIPGYGIPEETEGMLPWSHVEERLERATAYWVATADDRGRPHSTPIWGGYIDGRLYFEGSPNTRRGRNLAANPRVVVHLESADDVVIVEGTVEELRPAPEIARRLADALGAKYEPLGYRPEPEQWDEGGLYLVHPEVVFAWTSFPRDCTRFRFDNES